MEQTNTRGGREWYGRCCDLLSVVTAELALVFVKILMKIGGMSRGMMSDEARHSPISGEGTYSASA